MSTQPTPFDPAELRRNHRWIRVLATRLIADTQAAEDASQQAWLVALSKPAPPGVPLRSWVAGILRNLVRSRRRAQSRHRLETIQEVRDSESFTDEIVAKAEFEQKIAEVVLSLGEPIRSTLLMRYREDLDSAEIARRTGVPRNTVRSRVKRGLQQVRDQLDKEHGGDRDSWRAGAIVLLRAVPPRAASVAGILIMKSTLSVVAVALFLGVALFFHGPTVELASDTEHRSVEIPPDPSTDAGAIDVKAQVRTEPLVELRDARTSSEVVTFEVSGRCIDHAGEPLAGVSLRSVSVTGDVASDRMSLETTGQGTLSDHAGRFVLTEPLVDREMQEIELRFERADLIPRQLRTWASNGRSVTLGDVTLAFGASIRGRVVDESGRPVRGATVIAGSSEQMRSWRSRGARDGIKTTSDQQGRFEVVGVPFGWARIYAAGPRTLFSCSDPLPLMKSAHNDDVVVTVDRGDERSSISGFAIDEGGSPLPGARVSYSCTVGYSGFSGAVITDEGGRFFIRCAGDVPHEIGLTYADGRIAKRSGVLPGNDIVVMQLTPPTYCWLRVRDRQTRRPVADFSASISLAGKPVPLPRDFDDTGRVRFAVPDCEFTVHVDKAGYRQGSAGPFLIGSVPAEALVDLSAAPRVVGVVRAGSKAIAGARVELAGTETNSIAGFSVRAAPRADVAPVVTDSTGRFSITVERPDRFIGSFRSRGGAFYLNVTAKGWAAGEFGPFELGDSDQVESVVELVPGGGIAGQIFVPPGHSPEGVPVVASRGDGFLVYTRASADGTYQLDDLSPGAWQVELRDLSFHPTSLRRYDRDPPDHFPTNCNVVSGEVTHVDLERRESCILTGIVSAGSAAIPGFIVELRTLPVGSEWHVHPGDPTTHSQYSVGELIDTSQILPDRSFRLSAYQPGRYRLRITRPFPIDGDPFAVESKIDLVPGTQNNDILLGLGRIEGKVSATGFEGNHRGRIDFYRPYADGRRGVGHTFSTDEGDFTLPFVPAGPVYLSFDDGPPTEMVVEAGATGSIVLD